LDEYEELQDDYLDACDEIDDLSDAIESRDKTIADLRWELYKARDDIYEDRKRCFRDREEAKYNWKHNKEILRKEELIKKLQDKLRVCEIQIEWERKVSEELVRKVSGRG
jgi:predicted RNase H-like nuclease (RuvC/YqgF family)